MTRDIRTFDFALFDPKDPDPWLALYLDQSLPIDEGAKQALLIDTGDLADPAAMPLESTVMSLLPGEAGAKLPLIVVHSHGHLDHRAGDPQFEHAMGVRLVPSDLPHVREYFGFAQWPKGTSVIDLGDRMIDVLPAPGHHRAQLVFYDRNTGLVFSGDFLLPGRLLVENFDDYAASAQRVAKSGFRSASPICWRRRCCSSGTRSARRCLPDAGRSR